MSAYRNRKLSNLTVLVVEDEFLVLIDLQAQLEEAGARVVTANSLLAGLGLLAKSGGADLDGAILDIRLPDGEVFPLAERLRDLGIPLLFHSGHATIDELVDRFPGCVAVPKPASEATMLASLFKIISRRAEATP